MKWLTKLRLINWHFFEDTHLEFGRQTMITGRNSAGKSTIVDALQVLFIANQQQIRFNVAAMQEAKRTLLGYLRGKLGRDDKTYLRDGDFSSYIVAEFHDYAKREFFVAGVMFEVYRDDQIVEEYFILSDVKLADLTFVKPSGHLMNREEFRKSQGGNRGNAIFERNKSAYQKALLNRLGQIHERFTRVFPKALAFKPIENVREFVCSFILDEQNLQLDMMRQNFEVYEKYRRELDELKKRQEKLSRIAGHYDLYVKWRDVVAEQEYVIRKFRHLERLEVKERLEHERDSLEVAERTVKERLDLLEIKLAEAEENSRQAYFKWQTHSANRRREELLDQLNRTEQELSEKRKDLAVFVEDLAREISLLGDLSRLQEYEYWSWQPADQRRLDEISRLLSSLPPDDFGKDANLLSQSLTSAGDWLSALCDRFRKATFSVEARLEKLGTRQAELESQIRDLRQKKLTYPPAMERLKTLLEQKLAGRSPVWVFCEEMEIVDENWRNAVEGFLGMQRFDLLVEPSLFEEALSIYEQEKWKHSIENVGLVDTEKEQKYLGTFSPGSLRDLLTTENLVVQARIDHLAGRVMLARNEQELRIHSHSITMSCMSYQNLVARQIPKNRYEIPYIGAKAIPRQLEIRQRELDEVSASLEELTRARQTLSAWATHLEDKKGLYSTFSKRIELPGSIAAILSMQVDFQTELNALDLSEVDRLQKEYEHWKKQLEDLKDANRASIEEKTRIVGRLGAVETELHLRKAEVCETEENLRSWPEDYPLASPAGAEDRWLEVERQTLPFSERISRWESNQKGNRTRRDDEFQSLRDARHEFNLTYQHTADIGQEDNLYYQSLLAKLDGVDIPRYQNDVAVALHQSEEEFKSHFVYKLREAIEGSRRDFHQLNHTLKNFVYSDDRYRFDVKPSDRYRKYYDVVMDPGLADRGSLFEGESADSEKALQLRELFELLIHGDPAQQEEFTDYRRYLDFDIIVTDGAGYQSTFSKVLREKSGGETQTPFYIAILASFQQIYSDKSARLVVFDEAFNKMDEERILTSMRLIKRMNLQLIAVVPDEKMQHMAPEVTTTILVHREGARAYVDIIGRADLEEVRDDGKDFATGATLQAQDSIFTAGKA